MTSVSLSASERKPMAGAVAVGPAHPDERLEVTLLLRRADLPGLKNRLAQLHDGEILPPLSRAAFAAAHGATESDIAAVQAFASARGLAVASVSAARRTVILSGTVAQIEPAFGVTLQTYEHASGRYRGREGMVTLPAELQDIVQAVLGLDNRPAARAHFRHAMAADASAPAPATSFAPNDIAALYGFPAGDGAGQTIGIIELGGGFNPADLATYFQSLTINPAPRILTISVDHAQNQPGGGATGPDGEVMLDIEVAGAVAPGAKLAVYFAPITDAGFLNAVTTAIHDDVNRPSVVSISWGAPESGWTAQSIAAFEEAFQDAALLGVTVCASSGDNGSSDNPAGGADHVNFPASCPHALACGGTSLQAAGGAITSETVWNDGSAGASGGGISTSFPAVPSWQGGLAAAYTAGGSIALTGRGVPDVAADADPQTGYKVRVDGADTVMGGTSAATPLWAGLIARLNAKRGTPLGFISARLYQNPAAFRDIKTGHNGTYTAAPGWDAVTGLGSPNGAALAQWVLGGEATLHHDNNAKDDKPMTKTSETTSDKDKITDNATVIRGNAEPATEPPASTGLQPDATVIRGNAVKATPAPSPLEPDATVIRGN